MTGWETRYASRKMRLLWDYQTKILRERELWVTILEQQIRAGIAIPNPDRVLADYRAAAPVGPEDFTAITAYENVTLHDVKARLELFNRKAGHEYLHLGLTSRDITENVEQGLINESLELLCGQAKRVLWYLRELILRYRRTVVAARTHGVPAQPTLLGYRFAIWAEQLVRQMDEPNWPLSPHWRGVKGAVGNSADLVELIGGVDAKRIAYAMHYPAWLAAGQVYPRIQDSAIVQVIEQLCAGPAEACLGIRLMVTQGLADETNQPGQTGSSAMPHKSNPRYAERVCGLRHVVNGFGQMLRSPAGATWLEGDVSDTCIRRIAWPGIFMAADGLLRSAAVSLSRFQIHDGIRRRELADWAPLLRSGQRLARLALSEGREQAHARLREQSAIRLDAIHRADLPWPRSSTEERVQVAETGLALERTDQVLALLGWILDGFPPPEEDLIL